MSATHPPSASASSPQQRKHSTVVEVDEKIYPFRYVAQHEGFCQGLKMFFVGILFFIPRLIIFISSIFIAWTISSILLIPITKEHRLNFPVVYPIGRALLRLCARGMLFGLGYSWINVVDLRDPEDVKKNKANDTMPNIIVGNHYSWIDGPAMMTQENVSPIAKDSLFNMPIFGKAFRLIQMVPVDRLSKTSNKDVAAQIVKRGRWMQDQPEEVKKKYGNWNPILIFPEGTNTNGESIIQFKAGAFKPLVPVQPILLDYRQNHLNVAWAGDANPLTLTFCMMCQVYNKLTITYLPTEYPKEEGQSVVEFQERTRRHMAKEFGVPLTEHSFFDIILQSDALELGLSEEATRDFRAGSLALPLGEVRMKVKEFASFDKNSDGTIDEEEFSMFLGLGNSSNAETTESRRRQLKLAASLMRQWDYDGDGKINMNEFILFNECLKQSMQNGRPGVSNTVPSTSMLAAPSSVSPGLSPAASPLVAGKGPLMPRPGSGSMSRSVAVPPIASSKPSDVIGETKPGEVAIVDFSDPHTAGMELRQLFTKYFEALDPNRTDVVKRSEFVEVVSAHLALRATPSSTPVTRVAKVVGEFPPSSSSDSDCAPQSLEVDKEDVDWLFSTMAGSPEVDQFNKISFMDFCHAHPALAITLFTAFERKQLVDRSSPRPLPPSTLPSQPGSSLIPPGPPHKRPSEIWTEDNTTDSSRPQSGTPAAEARNPAGSSSQGTLPSDGRRQSSAFAGGGGGGDATPTNVLQGSRDGKGGGNSTGGKSRSSSVAEDEVQAFEAPEQESPVSPRPGGLDEELIGQMPPVDGSDI